MLVTSERFQYRVVQALHGTWSNEWALLRLFMPFQAVCCAITTEPCLTKRCGIGERRAGSEGSKSLPASRPPNATRLEAALYKGCLETALRRHEAPVEDLAPTHKAIHCAPRLFVRMYDGNRETIFV